ncbi:MAG TPA: hypothetical protein VHQ65_04290 [Thermoanaerobaculia bacterium]|nr:hypothetical protein [Thermoanaerobaculia bacterium]
MAASVVAAASAASSLPLPLRDGGVLVAGGDRDPNLRALGATLERRGVPHHLLLVGSETHPAVTWQLGDDHLEIDGQPTRPGAVFLRHDVFTHLADRRAASAHRALAWSTTVAAWIDAHPGVRSLNRGGLRAAPAKPYQLHLAARCGLPVPATLVTNHLPAIEAFLPGRPKIVKPVAGGDHARRLADALAEAETRDAATPAPAIVQRELVPPERRVFAVAGRLLGFTVASEALDYRTDPGTRVEPWPEVPEELGSALLRLLGELGLDFAAADFKTCPDTGRLLLLEINNGPMFAAFDRAADGAVTGALADFLVG